jgi:hypothetical protein
MTEPDEATPAVPRTYLWWAVGATALCFAPLGILTLFFAIRTLSRINHDDLDGAARWSRQARRWLIITVIVGLVVNLALLVVLGLLGAFST